MPAAQAPIQATTVQNASGPTQPHPGVMLTTLSSPHEQSTIHQMQPAQQSSTQPAYFTDQIPTDTSLALGKL